MSADFCTSYCTICSRDGSAKFSWIFPPGKKGFFFFFLKECDQDILGFCQSWLTKKWKLLEAFKLKILQSVSITSLFLTKNKSTWGSMEVLGSVSMHSYRPVCGGFVYFFFFLISSHARKLNRSSYILIRYHAASPHYDLALCPRYLFVKQF